MTTAHDLFFSYRRSDLARSRPLIHAMARAGLKVWRDENSIADGGPITQMLPTHLQQIRVARPVEDALLGTRHHSNERRLSVAILDVVATGPRIQRLEMKRKFLDGADPPGVIRDLPARNVGNEGQWDVLSSEGSSRWHILD